MLRSLRSWWRLVQAERRAARDRRRAAVAARRDSRRLSGLGACEGHVQSRYGLLKSREEMLG